VLSGWVDALVGWPFVQGGSPRRATVTVRAVSGGELLVTVYLAETPGAAGSPAPRGAKHREFRQGVSCGELLRTVALSLSLLAEPILASAPESSGATLAGAGSAPAPLPESNSPAAPATDPVDAALQPVPEQ